MKKKLFKISLALFSIFITTTSFEQEVQYVVSPTKSKMEWIGEKIVGGGHKGLVGIASGSYKVDMKSQKITSGQLVVDMKNITCTDIDDKEMNQKLVGHLKSEDFFHVAKFPKSTFIFSSMKGNEISGTLEIKGTKLPVKMIIELRSDKTNSTLAVKEFKLDRTKYNIRYGSNSFFDNLKDKAIGDIITFNINLVSDAASK